ncbi:MAG: histidine kinase [Bacteroidota bacterium]
MKGLHFTYLVILVIFSMLMLLAGLYLLAKFNQLFRRQFKNELLRKNIAVWLIAICLAFALLPTNPDLYGAISNQTLPHFFVIEFIAVTVETLFVFNISWIVVKYIHRKVKSFRTRMVIVLLTIIICTLVICVPVKYFADNFSFKNIEFTILFTFYTACMTGLIYITMSYVDLDRKRKLNEKELEVSRLQGLKTKAELEALHSKVNPHFLYNALNSIADLSITDGKKARKMTIALADLFRYSINYSDNNYSTIKEEIEMAEVYLLIEKIRFEDKLNYTIDVDEELNHYLVPRFVLQPIVENAVKHGLKATGQMTHINLEVKKKNDGLIINVADTGPHFPDELNPGYGVKSVFDKLDLLFQDGYEIHFSNEPAKQVSIYFKKLMKNEPAI